MAFELILKHWKKLVLFLTGSMLIILSLVGIGVVYNMNCRVYPEEKNLAWESEKPYIHYEKVVGDKPWNYYTTTVILVDGKLNDTFGISFTYGGVAYIFPEKGNQAPAVLSGHWSYKNGDLIVKIEKDDLFGGAYSQIIFHPVGDEP